MQVRINQVTRRYLMPPSQQDLKRRLDHLTEQLFREYFEVAMEQAGCRPSDILCIRYLHCPIRFETDKTDIDLFQGWLAQLVQSLSKLFAKPDDTVWLRFPSQIEALKSVGRSLAVKQLQLCWAWQQIGIIKQTNASLKNVKNQWLAYLWRNPQWAEAVLLGLANEGTFEQLIRAKVLTAGDLLLLMHKLSKASDTFSLKVINWSELVQKLNRMSPPETEASVDFELQLPSESEVNRIQGLWAVLYPAESLSECLRLFPTELVERIQVLSLLLMFKPNLQAQIRLRNSNSLLSQLYGIFTAVDYLVSAASASSGQAVLKQSSVSNSEQQQYEQARFTNTDHLVEGDGIIAPVISDFGGLLFVLNVLNQATWRNELDNLLGSISALPETLLERLAVLMLPEVVDDPILAIFSGTVFDSQQDKMQYSFNEPKQQSLDQYSIKQIETFALRLLDTVVTLLELNPAPSSVTNHHIFLQLCQRTVRIESQPGWVNVFFKMDSIDTKVRAVGLDLDPHYVPWLGYVVKFYYE